MILITQAYLFNKHMHHIFINSYINIQKNIKINSFADRD